MREKKNENFPLQGIKVLDLTRLIPGAFCTAILGDCGAEVIKVEEVSVGDYERQIHPFIHSMALRFLILNRNKKSIAVDLKNDDGREAFLKMARSADVLVEGFRPGAMRKLGLDYSTLQDINPRLIYCSISSFGQEGPYRDVVAHDINILGMAGFFDITGKKEDAPVIPGVQVGDSAAGMNAAMAILISLFSREKTNKGQYLDISMLDGVVSWLFDAARHLFAGERVPGRGEGRLWGGFPNYNLYETKDGKYLTVGSLETKFKKALLEKLGGDEFIQDETKTTSSRSSESDKELFSFLRKIFLTKTRDQWMEDLEGLNVCVGPVNTLEEGLKHPQVIFRNMVFEVDHPIAGRIRQIGCPLKFSDLSTDPNRIPAPRLGEHTREILSDLGYSEMDIDSLIGSKVFRD